MKIRFIVLVLATIFTTISFMATTQNVANSIVDPNDFPPDNGNGGGFQPGNGNGGGFQPGNGNGSSSTPIQAKFACVSQGNGYATVARKAEGETVLIKWNSQSFGPNYQPKERCHQVTGRLQAYVSSNGNDISNLLLTTGRVNGLPVICVVNSGQLGCNSNNVLFTLSKQNAADPGRTLAQFLNLSRGNISGNPIQERRGKSVVPLALAVDSSFSSPRSILERGGLNIVNCNKASASLIVFENSKVCVQPERGLKAGARYYYNSSTGLIQKQRI